MRQADIIIENAKVLTMDEDQPRAEAVALAGNRILHVGSRADVAELKSSATRVIDAAGATVLPGFIESHIHIFPGGVQLDSLNLAGITGFDNVARAVQARASSQPDGLILAEQAQYSAFGEGTPITRQILDQILPDRPLALYSGDHHTMWANTAALEKGGILHGANLPHGNEVVMGADGLATGELREFEAFSAIVMMTPTQGRELLGLATGRDPVEAPSAAGRAIDRGFMRRGLDYCASFGITAFHNMDGNAYQMELLQEIEHAEGLPVRARMPFRMLPDHPLSDLSDAVAQRRRWNTDRLRLDFVKLFMDGVIESTTAFMLDDYNGVPGQRGEAMFSAEDFDALCTEVDRLGFQITVHAIGDAAVRRTLDGYEAARRANGPRDSRHRIEHIETLDPADLPRFAKLGVMASVQPTHAPGGAYPTEPLATLIGRDRLMTAYAWQTLRRSGAQMVFSSDWPVAPLDPLLGIKTAVTRGPIFEGASDERQSLHDAIAGFTRDGAYAAFTEDRQGQLKAGMLADVVVLDGDIEAVEPAAIDTLKVQTTICDGRITYQA